MEQAQHCTHEGTSRLSVPSINESVGGSNWPRLAGDADVAFDGAMLVIRPPEHSTVHRCEAFSVSEKGKNTL